MRPAIVGLAVLGAALTGLLSGALLPLGSGPTAEASHRYTQWLFVHPTGVDTNYDGAVWSANSCGWHTACTSPTNYGRAIDFSKIGAEGQSSGVYVRTWIAVINPDNSGLQRVGYQYDYDEEATNPWTCYRTFTQLRDINNNARGYLEHTHAINPSWATFGIWGQPGIWSWNAHSAATMASDEKWECKIQGYWTGPHVHEYDISWNMTLRDTCPSANPYYVCGDTVPDFYSYPCTDPYNPPSGVRCYNAIDSGSWHRWIDWNY